MNGAIGAAGSLAQASAAKRAAALDAIASGLEDLGEELVEIADAETALGCERIRNERVRTCNQLRAFAQVATRGEHLDAVIDHADPDIGAGATRPAPDGGAHRADRRVRREQLSARVQCGGRRHRRGAGGRMPGSGEGPLVSSPNRTPLCRSRGRGRRPRRAPCGQLLVAPGHVNPGRRATRDRRGNRRGCLHRFARGRPRALRPRRATTNADPRVRRDGERQSRVRHARRDRRARRPDRASVRRLIAPRERPVLHQARTSLRAGRVGSLPERDQRAAR